MRNPRTGVALLLALALGSCKADSLLFEADPVSGYSLAAGSGNLSRYATQVTFVSGHDTLYGFYFHRFPDDLPVATGTVLLSHGRNGNMTRDPELARAAMIFNAGYDVFAYDYRGYGRSTGTSIGEASIDADAAAAYDFLVRSESIDPATLILYGHSIGAVPTITLAVAHPGARAVVLESAFTSGAAMQRTGTLVDLPVQWFLEGTYDNVDRIANVDAPVLVLHGALDAEVPVSQADQLYDRARDPKLLEIYPQADHDDVPQQLAGGAFAVFIANLVAANPRAPATMFHPTSNRSRE